MKDVNIKIQVPDWFQGTISINQMSLIDLHPYLTFNLHDGLSILKINGDTTFGYGCAGVQPVYIDYMDKRGNHIESHSFRLPINNRTGTETFNLFLKKINNLGVLFGIKYIRDLSNRVDNEEVNFDKEFLS